MGALGETSRLPTTGIAPSCTQRKHRPSERVWNLSAEDTYLEDKVRAYVCLSDQGKTVPAWECSGSSSAVLSRP